MNHTNDEMEIDLLRLMKALWRKAWAITLAAAIFGICFFAGTLLFIKPLYKAKALMYVNSSNISVGGTKVSITQSELTAAKTLVDTYIVILNTRATLEEVIAQSGVPYTYEELMQEKMIHAEAVNGTEVFAIEVTSEDPKEAELLANTIARVLPEKIAAIVEGSSARIVDYAVVPASKSSPNTIKNTVIGVLIGLILTCGVVVVQELLDEQIHDADYLTETYGIPVLAVIPDLLPSGSENDCYQHTEQSAKKRGENGGKSKKKTKS